MKKVFKYLGVIAAFAILGFILLAMIYKFSNFYAINNNAYNSGDIFTGTYNTASNGSGLDSYLDNRTDSLMISISSYEGNFEPIISAASAPRKDAKPECLYNSKEKYKDERNHIDTCLTTTTYERYWHGYQVVLRPLLSFFTYKEILNISSFVYFILLLTIAILMTKTTLSSYIIPFIISILSMNISSLAECLQYSTTTLTTFIFIVVLLAYISKKNNELSVNDEFYRYLFLLLGCAINYFDLLTFPIFSVGMLSIFYIIINRKNNYKEVIINLFINISLWCLGYSLMWILRWAISSIILNKNVFENAIGRASYRLSSTYKNQEFSIIFTITSNINRVSILNLSINVFYILFVIMTNIKQIKHAISLKRIIIFLLISIMPIVWWAVLRNHSAVHSLFTYKGIAVTLFAITSLVTLLAEKEPYLNID